MNRRLLGRLGWLGFGLVCLTLLLITINPGVVLGLFRPDAAVRVETRAANASQSVPVQVTSAAPTVAPASTGLPSSTTAEPTEPTKPTKPTESVEPTVEAPDGLPDETPAAGLLVDDQPSGLTPLAECCGGAPARQPLTEQKPIQLAKISDGRQQATLTVDSYGYSPAILVLQAGLETTLDFDLKQADSCSDQIWFSLLDQRFNLAAGERVPEFTPEADFAFSCWMGMQGVYVRVVEDLATADLDQIELDVANAFSEGGVACH